MKVAVLGSNPSSTRIVRDLRESGLHAESFVNHYDFKDFALVTCPLGVPRSSLIPAVSACIEDRVPVVCGCESEQDFEALKSLDERAREFDSLVVFGMGWSPGLSNLMARLAYDQLDSPSRVNVSWVAQAGARDREGFAKVTQALSGTAVLFEDGSWRRALAGQDPVKAYFPEPIGWRTVRIASSTEALTIPESLPGVTEVIVKGGLVGSAADFLARRAGEMRSETPNPATRGVATLMRLSALPFGRSGWSALRVDVGSENSGRPSVTLGLLDLLPNLESIPFVTVAQLALRGELKGAGLMSPEEVIEPKSFFAELAKRGMRLARLDVTSQPRP